MQYNVKRIVIHRKTQCNMMKFLSRFYCPPLTVIWLYWKRTLTSWCSNNRHFDTCFSEKSRVCARFKFCVASVIENLANSTNLISLHGQKYRSLFAENSTEFIRIVKQAWKFYSRLLYQLKHPQFLRCSQRFFDKFTHRIHFILKKTQVNVART